MSRLATLRRCVAGSVPLLCLLLPSGGCTWVSYLGTDARGRELGKTWYVGGAGPLGHVGTLDVPKALRRAGYRGAVEAFGWQSVLGGTLRDQVDATRNRQQAQRLARRIEAYARRHPDRRINLIALSAGTGIATWALEALPPDVVVDTVVFLGSSLSRDYDLTAALRHVEARLYNFFSPRDPILRVAVPLAGSFDRQTRGPDLAGLMGFAPTDDALPETVELYDERLRNMPHKPRYGRYGYQGLHTDAVSQDFIELVVAPMLIAPRRPPTAFDERIMIPDPEPAAAIEPSRSEPARVTMDRPF